MQRAGCCVVFVFALICVITAQLPSNVTGIIKGYGYPVEEHLTPPTSDGWQLVLHRIPYGKAGPSPRKGVVLFQHGLTDCSVGVNLNLPYESLSFILADNGYDVWMGNNRGNGYSMKNIYHTRNTREFWDFSFDDMADIDLPAQVNYVLSVTQKKKLAYIGHSEGTIQAFAGLIDNPDLVSKLNLYVALAPVAYTQYVESLILKGLADLHAEEIFILLGDKEFSLPVAIEKILPGICTATPRLCQFIVDLLTGPTTFFNDSRASYYLHYEPNPTSVKNMAHWAQCVRKGTFEKYDYGKQGNIQHYNQPDPPQYDLRRFPTQSQLPLALFTGGNDYLADPKDVERLLTLLPTPPFVHTEEEYAHLDPLIGINAFQRIYPLILKLLGQYSQG